MRQSHQSDLDFIVFDMLPKFSMALLVFVLVNGCSTYDKFYKPNPELPEVEPVMAIANPAPTSWQGTDGSIWPTDRPKSLFADDKARLAGDIVLVNVRQNTQGSSSATTDSSREASISATVKRLFGFEEGINDLTNYTNINAAGVEGEWNPHPLVEASSENEFSGTGTTERSDSLTATVSAVVTEVLNNGNLQIYGSQMVTLNNEARVLTVQGVIRPNDIGADNTIDSSRIALAKISMDGEGVVSDKQKPGWGMRIFDNLWIF